MRVRWDSDPRHFNPVIYADWLRARRSTWLSYEPTKSLRTKAVFKLIDRLKKNKQLSNVICTALMEHLEKKTVFDLLRGCRDSRTGRYNLGDIDVKQLSEERLQLSFESVLPSIAEPLSKFRYEDNKMYFYTSDELSIHFERAAHLIIDGVQKSRKVKQELKERFGELEEDEEDKEMAKGWILEYIIREIVRPQQRSPRERREERMKQLQEELRRLTEQQQQETEWIGQNLPPPTPSTPPTQQQQEEGEQQQRI